MPTPESGEASSRRRSMAGRFSSGHGVIPRMKDEERRDDVDCSQLWSSRGYLVLVAIPADVMIWHEHREKMGVQFRSATADPAHAE